MPKINEEKRKANQEHLLKVAADLFKEKGYNGTSINDIVKAANVSKGGFYTYYASKEDLFFQLIHGADQKIIHYGRDLVFEGKENALAQYIEYRLRRYLDEENRVRGKYIFEFWTSVTLSDDQRLEMNRRYNEFKGDILALLSMKHNGVRGDSDTPHRVVDILIATLDGLILSDVALARPINEGLIETTIKIFTHYLKGDDI